MKKCYRLLWNPKVRCVFQKNPPPALLRQMDPIHALSPCFPKTHFKIILPAMPTPSERSVPFRFPKQNFVHIYFPMCPSPEEFFTVTYLIVNADSQSPNLNHKNCFFSLRSEGCILFNGQQFMNYYVYLLYAMIRK